MDLRYTPEQDAFRAEARAWLEANVPAEPLPSFDTEAGFAAAPRVGAQAVGRTVVGGVVARGVRRPRRRLPPLADLRRGVLPRRRARPGEPERHLPARPDDHGGRHRRAEGALPAHDGVERDRVGAGVERAERRIGSRRDPVDGRAHRRWRRVGPQRAEDLGVTRGVRRLVLRHLPHRSRRRAPPRSHLRAGAARFAGRHRAPDRAARRRHRLRRDLLRRRARPRGEHARRGEPGMERRDGDRGVRARGEPAQPGALQRRRRSARGSLARARGSAPTTRCATRSPTPGCTPRGTGCTPT